jgi:signal recognition particle receptor subunit beta
MEQKTEHNKQSYKIIITGSFLSGKTSFIRAISEINLDTATEQAVNNTTNTSTIRIDWWGKVEVEGGTFYLFDPPTTLRFRFMSELGDDLLGYVIMVGSTIPESFRETREVMATFTTYFPKPYVIAASESDKPNAWDVEALRIALRVSDEIPIIPCTTHDKKSVASVLIALCEEILKDINANKAES